MRHQVRPLLADLATHYTKQASLLPVEYAGSRIAGFRHVDYRSAELSHFSRYARSGAMIRVRTAPRGRLSRPLGLAKGDCGKD
jgi:hypothetical protein